MVFWLVGQLQYFVRLSQFCFCGAKANLRLMGKEFYFSVSALKTVSNGTDKGYKGHCEETVIESRPDFYIRLQS